LAPDIQEHIIFLPTYASGRAPLTDREVRPIVAEPDWGKQRERLAKFAGKTNRTK